MLSDLVSRDPDTNEITYTVTPYTGPSGVAGEVDHDSLVACDQILFDRGTGIQGFATDPLNRDTDGDLVEDGLELLLGLNPNDGSDGPLFLDDDGDGLPNKVETDGYIVNVNRSAADLDGTPTRFTSNPNKADTDDDGLPDLLESYILSNPRSADTDGDLVSDRNEYKVGGNVCVAGTTVGQCILFRDLITKNYQDYLNACSRADNCDNSLIEQGITSNSLQVGTSLSERDTDDDNYWDLDEITPRVITVNGGSQSFTTNPVDADSDDDGIQDGTEVYFFGGGLVSNPTLVNTDGEGGSDLQERNSVQARNPSIADKYVVVTVGQLYVNVNNAYEAPKTTISATSSDGLGINNFENSGGDYGDFALTVDAPAGLFNVRVIDRVVSDGESISVFSTGSFTDQVIGIPVGPYRCSPNQTITNLIAYSGFVDGASFDTDIATTCDTADFDFGLKYQMSVDSDL